MNLAVSGSTTKPRFSSSATTTVMELVRTAMWPFLPRYMHFITSMAEVEKLEELPVLVSKSKALLSCSHTAMESSAFWQLMPM